MMRNSSVENVPLLVDDILSRLKMESFISYSSKKKRGEGQNIKEQLKR